MAIQFGCPQCGKQLKVGDHHANKAVKCPGCATLIQVPAAESSPRAADATPRARSVDGHRPTRDRDRDDDRPSSRRRRDDDDDRHDRDEKRRPSSREDDREPPPGDDDDDAAPRKKKGKKTGGRGLVLWLAIGGGALVLLVGGGLLTYFLFFANTGLGDEMNYLPDDPISITSENVDKSRHSGLYARMKKEVPEAFDKGDGFNAQLGLRDEDISRSTTAHAKESRQGVGIIRLIKPMKAEEVKSKLEKDKVKYKEMKAGDAVYYEPEDSGGGFVASQAFHVRGTMIVFGPAKTLKAILERKGPPKLSDRMRQAIGKTDFGAAAANIRIHDSDQGGDSKKPTPEFSITQKEIGASQVTETVTGYFKDPRTANEFNDEMVKEIANRRDKADDKQKAKLDRMKVSVSGSTVTMVNSQPADEIIDEMKSRFRK